MTKRTQLAAAYQEIILSPRDGGVHHLARSLILVRLVLVYLSLSAESEKIRRRTEISKLLRESEGRLLVDCVACAGLLAGTLCAIRRVVFKGHHTQGSGVRAAPERVLAQLQAMLAISGAHHLIQKTQDDFSAHFARCS